MEVEEKREILKHIRLGTKEVLFFPYNNGKDPLPLRPISTWELDDCFYKALEDTPNKIADFIVKVKLDLIDRKTNINVENTGYVKLMKFYNTIDYWIVYYAMKDFQDELFSTPNYNEYGLPNGFSKIKEMTEIHEIAKYVLSSSSGSNEVIKEIFKNDIGKELGYMILFLNQPLADIKDITKLQRDFVIYTKGEFPKIIKGDKVKNKYVISGQKMTVKEVMEKFV